MKAKSEWFIYDVDEKSFPAKVVEASRDHLVMVDFWAEWCPPCRALTPVLERIAREFNGNLLLAKVEVDENMRLAGHYKLRGFPTVIFFREGEPVDHFTGYKAVHTIRETVEGHLAHYEDGERAQQKAASAE
jgi:thioredoxin 1